MDSSLPVNESKPQRRAFKMFLYKGFEDEYKKRHDAIWPELKELLKAAGIRDYSIYLDEDTHILFVSFTFQDKDKVDALPQHTVMQKWWGYMKDIMESNADHSPVVIPLKEMFHLP
jgi:L-rhamnose mutarotase